MNGLELNKQEIAKLCQTHKVKSLYAFGAVLTEKFGNESDIDLLVDFDNVAEQEYTDNYFDFKFSMENVLKRNIDLVEEKTVQTPQFKKTLNKQKMLVFG